MQVLRWDEDLAVRLPKALVEKMGLGPGDELDIVDVIGRTLVVHKADGRKAALERLASRNWNFLPTTSSIGRRRTSGEGVIWRPSQFSPNIDLPDNANQKIISPHRIPKHARSTTAI